MPDTAEDLVVRHALARGYVTPEQAHDLHGLVRRSGRSGELVAALRAQGLRPEHAADLDQVWQQARGSTPTRAGSERLPAPTLAPPRSSAASDRAPTPTLAPPPPSSPTSGRLPASTLAPPPGSDGGPAQPPDASAAERVLQAYREALGHDAEFDPLAEVRLERLDELGRGGMGVVYRVKDARLGREAALKLVLREGSGSAAERFVREVRLTARLEHPSIPPVYAAGTTSRGEHYLLMKLIKGQPLSTRLAEHDWTRPVDDEERRWLNEQLEAAVKVGEAVAYAHGQGIVHRDLKPANVMVGQFGEVLVMDWGLAKDLNNDPGQAEREDHLLKTRAFPAVLRPPRDPAPRTDGTPDAGTLPAVGRRAHEAGGLADPGTLDAPAELTRVGALLGTPGFMAPEQAAGKPTDARADVFALGAFLCAVLTGRSPYDEQGAVRLVTAAVQGRVVLPRRRRPGLPPELESIAAAALTKEPDDRTESADAFVRDLRAYLRGEVVLAHRYSLRERATRAARRHTTLLVGLGAGLLALLGIGLAVAFARGQQARAEQEQAQRQLADERASRAQAQREQAQRSADELAAEKARSQVYTDGGKLKILRQAQAEVGAGSKDVPALARWLGEAGDLRTTEHVHRARQQALEAAPAPSAVERAELQALRELLGGLEWLGGEAAARVEARLAFARTVHERTVAGPDARAAWAAAARQVRASPRYKGLALEPVEGFLPLGLDRASALLEVWHPQSGERPRRGPDGRWALDPETGLLFVLVPGGTITMGQPPREVRLRAFFLCKWEMTQAQWLRATGENPSFYQATEHMLLNPVEQVSWDDCQATLPLLQLRLPEEAEWEYAARAGTTSDWWTGDDATALRNAANLADESLRLVGGTGAIQPWDDGHTFHAQVGRFRANAYGLHDVHGNVQEWVQDAYQAETGSPHRVFRGGSWATSAAAARSAYRGRNSPATRSSELGLRPARSLP